MIKKIKYIVLLLVCSAFSTMSYNPLMAIYIRASSG